ncbi:SMC family ATPase [Klugiella xanthotipulae]|uniref:Nuclease SbcCD subunit C n=1 Tax=Klugiella xanthotipulae TaxID=244735 RepID=A0A543HYB2_9MICO|nr:AAA family ATPase [Klugiella xanthotipulae]TQM63331.1 exonuclease SbcC [Klugiella xanthotipulae]
MRILRLTFAGIGPYRDEQQIDFERLEADGIYLIAGQTGAGKSTILDAICFALYGSVPRFEGSRAHLRSDHSGPGDPTFATLDFECGGRVYRVTRSPEWERNRKRGSGTTRQAARATLMELTSEGSRGMSSSAQEIGAEIARIVGLSKDQFLQVILLAQNRFHEFLLAKNEARQDLLRSLFGTQRFERLRLTLVERCKTLGGELQAERGLLDALADQSARLAGIGESPGDPDAEWFRSLVPACVSRLAAAQVLVREADARYALAEVEVARVQRIHALQARHSAARVEHSRLSAQRPHRDSQSGELAAAQRADAVHSHLQAESAARAVRDAALTRWAETADALRSLTGDEPNPETAVAEVRSLIEQRGALDQALADERALPGAEAEGDRATRERDTAEGERSATATRLAGLPERIEAVQETLRAARERAILVEPLRAERDRCELRQAAARQLVDAVATHSSLAAAHLTAVTENSAATHAHEELVIARFRSFAAELAIRLVPGQPCAVCGATEHPAPTPAAEGGLVAPTAIESARQYMDECRARMDTAQRDLAAAGERVAAMRVEAGPLTVEEAAEAVAQARQNLDEAEDARSRAAAVEEEQAALRAEQDAAAALLESQEERREAAVSALAAALATRAALTARVIELRGTHDSVADRVAELERRRELTEAYVVAADSARTAVAAADAAGRAVEVQLAERGFARRDDARAAHRGAEDLAELAEAVASFDRELAGVSAILAEPELADLPAEPVDLSGPAAALAEVRTSRDAALAERATRDERAQQVEACVTEALARLEEQEAGNRALTELRGLAETVDGKGPNTRSMKLESFVLAARLEEIVAAANARLGVMTSGRYSLEHDDSLAYRGAASGLGVLVFDGYTGVRRQPASLSGGETFLASLALALGLADVVTAHSGGIELDTMFIDEGFGSLDPETLDIALSTLDGLRAGGRTVGLISHVDAMRERIPVGVQVRVADTGESALETGAVGRPS